MLAFFETGFMNRRPGHWITGWRGVDRSDRLRSGRRFPCLWRGLPVPTLGSNARAIRRPNEKVVWTASLSRWEGRQMVVSYMTPWRVGTGLRSLLTTLIALALVAACGPPGAGTTSSSGGASGGTAGCGKDPVKLNAYFETGFDLPFKLSNEFTKQYPNVSWDIKQDQFTNLINETPRVLASNDPPDLIRLPTMVSFAKEGLLKNLDAYASGFGWDKWPVPQLIQNRVGPDG